MGPLLKMGSQTWETKRSFQVDSLWASEHPPAAIAGPSDRAALPHVSSPKAASMDHTARGEDPATRKRHTSRAECARLRRGERGGMRQILQVNQAHLITPQTGDELLQFQGLSRSSDYLQFVWSIHCKVRTSGQKLPGFGATSSTYL